MKTTLNRSRQSDPIQALFDAYNAHDLDTFLSCFGSDICLYDGTGRITGQGLSELRSSYQDLFEASPKVKTRIKHRIFIGDDDVQFFITEEHVSGYMSRGRERRFVIAAQYEIRGGLIRAVRFLTPPFAL